jgi:hypothetical protein
MRLALLILGGALCSAQSFYAAGVSVLPSTQPEPTPWTVVATPASGNKVWSISGTNYGLTQGPHPQFLSTAWSALATPAQTEIGNLKLFLLAGLGASVAGTNAGYSIVGGTIGYYQLGKSAWAIVGGYAVQKSSVGGTVTRGTIGIGRSF